MVVLGVKALFGIAVPSFANVSRGVGDATPGDVVRELRDVGGELADKEVAIAAGSAVGSC